MTKIKMKAASIAIVMFTIITFFSCANDIQQEVLSSQTSALPKTRAEIVDDFDWETVDYMPYPSKTIPVPWIGQGSLASDYSLDVVNDHRKADGWELVYSTFKKNAATNNPYFILYNKYRGLMRIYIYVTNQSIVNSTNTHNFISINSSYKTSMLNFLGKALVDGSERNNSYDEISQNPTGTAEYAPNKWYMTQYEFAYDPNIANQPYNSIILNFNTKYLNAQNININGSQTGTINGTIGGSGGNLLSALRKSTTSALSGSFGFIGKEILNKYSTKDNPKGNTLGIDSASWKAAIKGTEKLVTSGVNGTLENVADFLCGMIFGSGTPAETVDLKFDSSISMKGTITESGLFPSMPISVYMPGTNIPANAQGQIPNYNYPLGVFNVIEKPDIYMTQTAKHYRGMDEYGWSGGYVTETITTLELSQNHDLSELVKINPAVLNSAKVDISYDIIGKTKEYGYEINPSYSAYESDIPGSFSTAIPKVEMMVRYRIKVTPFDTQISPSVIYKTFKLNPVIHYVNRYYGYDRISQKEKETMLKRIKNRKQIIK